MFFSTPIKIDKYLYGINDKSWKFSRAWSNRNLSDLKNKRLFLKESKTLIAVCDYEADDNSDMLSLVEGERVILLDTSSKDWWFVMKKSTEESGWVPADILEAPEKYEDQLMQALQEIAEVLPTSQYYYHHL